MESVHLRDRCGRQGMRHGKGPLITTMLAGAGYSISSGLNAYLPLLILALTDRVSTSFNLDTPYNWISTNVGIFVVLLLLPVELIGDKIPRLDHFNDLAHTAIRPLTGAFCFMAVASERSDVNVWFAGVLGLAIAACFHTWKMRWRIRIAQASSGLGTPFASLQEDGVGIVVSILAAAAPIANVVVIPLGVALIRRSYLRLATGKSRLVRAFQPKPRT